MKEELIRKVEKLKTKGKVYVDGSYCIPASDKGFQCGVKEALRVIENAKM